jgi:hypothetical protein
MKPEGASGLGNRQALAMLAILGFGKRLVIDHDLLRGQARFSLACEQAKNSRRLIQVIHDLIMAENGSSSLPTAETIPVSM